MLLTTIFYHIDDFCKVFESEMKKHLLSSKKGNRRGRMTLSDIMTITVYFHHSGYRTFKDYYTKHVSFILSKAFNNLVSYNRFVELQQQCIVPLALLAKIFGMDKCTGVSFIDSFKLNVCHSRRERSHKTFKGLAQKGKTSVGWFFGFKVHLVISHRGDIIDFAITPGNTADSNHDTVGKITEQVYGKLFGDKGYIGQKLFEKLYKKNVQLITRIRSNMKKKLVGIYDKILLRKRGVVESVIAILKEKFNIEHTRHRSPLNFLSNICSTLVAYIFKEKKPSIKLPKELLMTSF